MTRFLGYFGAVTRCDLLLGLDEAWIIIITLTVSSCLCNLVLNITSRGARILRHPLDIYIVWPIFGHSPDSKGLGSAGRILGNMDLAIINDNITVQHRWDISVSKGEL